MSFWNRKKDYSVCEQCGVHFEPVRDSDFPNLCSVHRKEPEELRQRELAVINWAVANWRRLEDQMKNEHDALYAAYNANCAAQMQAMSAAQQSSASCGFGAIGMAQYNQHP